MSFLRPVGELGRERVLLRRVEEGGATVLNGVAEIIIGQRLVIIVDNDIFELGRVC